MAKIRKSIDTMSCWKCGRECEGGECSDCSGESVTFQPKVWLKLDMSKVKSLQDILAILDGLNISVEKGSREEEKLRKFIKDGQ